MLHQSKGMKQEGKQRSELKIKAQKMNNKPRLTLKHHSIDIKKQYIKIDKNLIDFSMVSGTIKYFFVQVYKKCASINCLHEIFQEISEEKSTYSQPRSIQIKDVDAMAITIKMFKCIHRQKIIRKLDLLKMLLQKRNNKLKQWFDFRQQMNQKHESIHKIINQKTEKITQEQFYLLQRLKDELEKVNMQIKKLSQQREKIQSKLMHYYDKMQVNSPSKQLSICLNKSINKLARNLIKGSILTIIQNQQQKTSLEQSNHAYIVFEQSYHTIKMRKNDIIKLIGSQTYIDEIKNSESLKECCQSNNSQDLMCCHNCLSLYDSANLYLCNKKINKKLTIGYDSSDYFIYRNHYITTNYFKEEEDSHVLSFFMYNQSENNQLICNRGFCAQCLVKVYKMDPYYFSCPYCEGKCNCQRCEMAMALVKLIAHDLEFDSHQLRNYHNILDLLKPQKSKYVLDSLKLRKSKGDLEYNLILKSCEQKQSHLSEIKQSSQQERQDADYYTSLLNYINKELDLKGDNSNINNIQVNNDKGPMNHQNKQVLSRQQQWSQFIDLN